MEAENGMFCELKKIFQPQLVVILEPACKILESRTEDSAVCYFEDEPEVELPINKKILDESQDPLMFSDDDEIDILDEREDNQSPCPDEEVRQILSEIENEKPLVSPQNDAKTESGFREIYRRNSHRTLVGNKQKYLSRITSTKCIKEQLRQTAHSSQNQPRRRRNNIKRYSPSDWSNGVSHHHKLNKPNKANCKTSHEISQSVVLSIFQNELERIQRNERESLRRVDVAQRFQTLYNLISEGRTIPPQKMTCLYTLTEAQICIEKLKRRERFLVQTKQNLLKRNDLLNSKLLDLYEK